MNTLEWEVYSRWANFLLTSRCTPPTGFIYLRAAPKTCLERVKKRQRSAEDSLTLEYLEQIHQKHDDFLIYKKGLPPVLAKVPVLIIESEDAFLSDKSQQKRIFGLVEEFVTLHL
jgi:deoxyadenosine/deoxycytidine kinase